MNDKELAKRIIDCVDCNSIPHRDWADAQLKKMDRSSPVAAILIQTVLDGPLRKNKVSRFTLAHLIPLLGDQGVIELTDKILSSYTLRDTLKDFEPLVLGVKKLASDTTTKVVLSRLLEYLLELDAKRSTLKPSQARELEDLAPYAAREATEAIVEELAPHFTGDHIDAIQTLVPVEHSGDIKVFLKLIPQFSEAQWDRLQHGLIYARKLSDERYLHKAFQQIPTTANFDTDEYIIVYARAHWGVWNKSSIDAMVTVLSLRESVDSRILVPLCPGVTWILDLPITEEDFKMRCLRRNSSLVSIANLAMELFRLLGFNPHTQPILDGLVGSEAMRYGETRSHYLSAITEFPNWYLVAQKWRLIRFVHHHFIWFGSATPKLIEKIYRNRPSVRGHILKEFADAFLKDYRKPYSMFSTDRPDLGIWLTLLLKLLKIDRSDEAATNHESAFWLGTRKQLGRAFAIHWYQGDRLDETVYEAAVRLISAIRVVGYEAHFKGRGR